MVRPEREPGKTFEWEGGQLPLGAHEATVVVGMVIIGWRNEGYAVPFVESLLDALSHSDEVVVRLAVVVNGPEGTACAEELSSVLIAGPRLALRFVWNDSNVGYAAGMDAGARALLDSGPVDCLVLLNLDGEISPGFFAALRPHVLDRSWDLLVPRVVTHGRATELVRRGWTNRYSRPCDLGTAASRGMGSSGACLILSKRLVDARLNYWGAVMPPEYHSYGEDQELFLWLENQRGVLRLASDVVFSHAHAGSFKGLTRLESKPDWLIVHVLANYRVNQALYGAGLGGTLQRILGQTLYEARILMARGVEGVVVVRTSRAEAKSKLAALRARRVRAAGDVTG